MIRIKTPEQIEEMKVAGALSKMALRRVGAAIRPGVLTSELDGIAESVIRMHRAIPTFKGYGGFPASICCSVNDEVVHGIPGMRMLEEGDIVSIDTGATKDGWVGDNAWTFPCGKINDDLQRLLDVTEQSMWAGIDQARPGNHLGDIGHAVQTIAEGAGFKVVREYVGHGIGRDMHEDPNVPNFGKAGTGVELMEGMVLAIEPMVNMKSHKTRQMKDGWGVKTADHKPSAHFERTVAITADGPIILTKE